MPSNPPLEQLIGDVDAGTRQALRDNEPAIREHTRGEPVTFIARGTASDGQNVDRDAFIYLTATVIGFAVNGAVVNGFPRRHITDVQSFTESDGWFAVVIEAAPMNSRYELRWESATTQQEFVAAVTA